MALFRRRTSAQPAPEPAAAEERSFTLPNGMWAPTGGQWAGSTAGVPVTIETALRDAAAWACQRVMVLTVSNLPVHAYSEERGGRLRKMDNDPPLVKSPSGSVTRRQWVAQMVRSGMQCGNMYGQVVDADTLGRARQVETVNPSQVAWQVVDGREVPYVSSKSATLWPLGRFWHVPVSQFMIAGSRVAMSPTEYGSTGLGTTIAAEDNAARYFADGLHPTKIAKSPVPLTQEQAQAIKASLYNAMHGNREVPVIGADITFEDWQSSMSDSQMMELLQFEVLQACRRWGVPPSMVYAAVAGQNVTYANVSQADLQFLKYGAQGWIADLEDAWSDLAETPVRFTTEAILAMDAISRAQLHEIRLRTKTRTPNEVRVIEDEEPFPEPEYDQPGVPGGYVAHSAPPAAASTS